MELEQATKILNQMHIDHARLMTRIADGLATGGETGVLLWLRQQSGGTFAMDIAEHFALSPGRVANIVRQLEARQYIIRQPDEQDQRRVYIYLTETGAKVADHLYGEMNANHRRIMDALGEDDAGEWIRILRRLIAIATEEETLHTTR